MAVRACLRPTRGVAVAYSHRVSRGPMDAIAADIDLVTEFGRPDVAAPPTDQAWAARIHASLNQRPDAVTRQTIDARGHRRWC